MFDSTTARVYVSLGSCAALGGGLLLYSARWGIGLSPDSVVYIGAARSLLAGAGFSLPAEWALFSPITHYLPLYSSLLAVIAILGPDPLDGAIWLNVAVFGINIFLTGSLLFSALRSLQIAMIGSFLTLTLTAFPIVQVHTMAWSESSFILFELLSILLLLRYLKHPSKQTLVLASAVAGLSLLWRYAGRAVVASGMLAILFLGGREKREKLTDALVFAGIGVLPVALWVAQNYAGREWRESQILNRLRWVNSSKPLFSNAPDVLYTFLSKPAVMVPRKTHTDTNLPNQDYALQISELARRLKEDSGLLVYFHSVGWRWYLPAAEELERTLGLKPLARENDGVIYQAR